MALMTRTWPEKTRRRGGRHARSTSLWQQLGWGRRTACSTPTQPLMTPAVVAPAPLPAEDQQKLAARDARLVVEALFRPTDAALLDGLYPLDWQYGYGSATAQVAPALIPDAARNVVLAYAEHMAAGFMQEELDGRLRIRTARAYAGVTVTVWADITPDPTVEITPPALVEAAPELPIEHLARAACLETQEFVPVAADEGPEHPDGDPDTGAQETEPEGPSREPAEPLPAAATAATEDDDTPLPADADEQNQDTAA